MATLKIITLIHLLGHLLFYKKVKADDLTLIMLMLPKMMKKG